MSTPSICYLNGEFLPLENAQVSVLDRGFIFGDGIYEVIPVYGTNPFRLKEHLQRLDNSLKAVRMVNPLSDAQWEDMLTKLISQNSNGDQSVYMQITRGVAKRDHAFPANTKATVFAMSSPLPSSSKTLASEGVTAITLDDIRWRYCNIKSIALLPNILLRQQALDNKAVEAILVREGMVTEGAASNVFIVKNGVIKTPVKSECLLPGITRDLIVELAVKNKLPCEETEISEAELLAADEIWLSSSIKEILPVTRLNDKTVADGKPGKVWQQMQTIFQDYKQRLRDGIEVE
ncbi:MAG: D-amino acid aminotransferase [Gammaproteobacteria bacterium]|nr:D-amino acid aminotransferase [Gammaproteobacteria bacterium]